MRRVSDGLFKFHLQLNLIKNEKWEKAKQKTKNKKQKKTKRTEQKFQHRTQTIQSKLKQDEMTQVVAVVHINMSVF